MTVQQDLANFNEMLDIVKNFYATPQVVYVNEQTFKGLQSILDDTEVDEASKTKIGQLLYK